MRIRLSTILTGISVVGVVVTGYLSAKGGEAAAKAKQDLEEFSLGDPDKKVVRRIVVRCYAKAAVAGAVTIGAMVGANIIDGKTIATLGGALGLATTQLDRVKDEFNTYQNAVADEVGEEKEAEIRRNICNKVVRDSVTGMEEGVYTFHIDWTGVDIFFDNKLSEIIDGEATVNKILWDCNDIRNDDGLASVSDFLRAINHPELVTKETDEIGWDGVELVNGYCVYWLKWGKPKPQMTPEGKVYYDIQVEWTPWRDFVAHREIIDENREERLRQILNDEVDEKLPFD